MEEEASPEMKAIFMEVVENQIRENEPPEAKATFDRLTSEGITKDDAKKYIGQAIAIEMFDIVKTQEPFNEKRYIKNLLRLPKEPSL